MQGKGTRISRFSRIPRYQATHTFLSRTLSSHVTMSVSKLLSRIIHPSQVTTDQAPDKKIARDLHDHTYVCRLLDRWYAFRREQYLIFVVLFHFFRRFGITSDPLTHFACVVSRLLHTYFDLTRIVNLKLTSSAFYHNFMTQLAALIHDVGTFASST